MLIAIAAAALITSGAEEPNDPDGVVATAPAGAGSVMVGAVAPTSDARPDAAAASRVTTQDLTTQEQIDRWISARTPDVEPFADETVDDRQVHGFASVGVGTHDYSSVAVGVSLPIGENGRIDLSYSQTKNGYGYPGYGYGYPGYGYAPVGYGAYPGDYGYGLGYHARPFGAGSALRSPSARSFGLGFHWEEDKDRDDQRIRRPSAEN